MEKINLAFVDSTTRFRIKNQAVRLHVSGKKHKEIVEALGISYDAVSRIVRAYRANGNIPSEKPRGRKRGEQRTLSAMQEMEIQRIIIEMCPDRLKLHFALWTRGAVKQLIRDLYDIDMPLRSISNYLKRWGMTCQNHIKEHCFFDVQRWNFMRKEYPILKMLAQKDRAAIYWGAEAGINNQQCYGSTRYCNNMLSAISGRGTCRFMCFWGAMTPRLFIDFMQRLVMDSSGKTVFLIVDIHEVYFSKLVCDWLEENKGTIKVFFCSDPFS